MPAGATGAFGPLYFATFCALSVTLGALLYNLTGVLNEYFEIQQRLTNKPEVCSFVFREQHRMPSSHRSSIGLLLAATCSSSGCRRGPCPAAAAVPALIMQSMPGTLAVVCMSFPIDYNALCCMCTAACYTRKLAAARMLAGVLATAVCCQRQLHA